MQTEYLYPDVGDRRSPNDWAERGSLDVLQRAAEKARDILARHYPTHIPDAVDAAIRRDFPVRLAREGMRPAIASPASTPLPGSAPRQVRV
jgi:trimethylamine--corrinoid protein Co-methyltransferase